YSAPLPLSIFARPRQRGLMRSWRADSLCLRVARSPELPHVAKRFCASEWARLIQNQGSRRKVDSRIHSPRFDCCAFLFYSFSAVTFATESAPNGNALPETSNAPLRPGVSTNRTRNRAPLQRRLVNQLRDLESILRARPAKLTWFK